MNRELPRLWPSPLRFARSSRPAIRTPRSGTYVTNWAAGTLVALTLLAASDCSRLAKGGSDGAASAKNLLIVTIDTLRADRVGATATPPPRTPAIDALAARGVRVHARLFVGADHADLACDAHDRPLSPGPRRSSQRHRLDPTVPTLADTLTTRVSGQPLLSVPFR